MKQVSLSAPLLLASVFFSSVAQAQTVVCVETNLDSFCMELLQSQAPQAAANFLRYVDDGDYNSTLIHQSVRGRYLEGGQWQASLDPQPVAVDPPIPRETSIANTRGTVAFVTTPGQASGGQSAWRINVSENTGSFSASNSGAVFARILGSGMSVVDRMSKLSVHALNSGHLAQAPLLQLDSKVTADDVVQVKRVYRYAGTLADFNNYGLNFPPKAETLPQMESVVCMQTSLGELCVRLFPQDAPVTVANFLKYVNDGDYDGTFFHRSVTGFVVQGGGFRFNSSNSTITEVPVDPAIVNEYKLPNVANTIAMAKRGGDPNSATNQWFINVTNNTDTLNTSNNGGFTVFGEVIRSDIGVLSDIAAIRAYDLSPTLGATFNEVPLINPDAVRTIDDFVNVERVFVTQRDVAAAPENAAGPLDRVVALGSFGAQPLGFGTRLPVRINDQLYQLSLLRSENDPSVYSVDLVRIVQLIDNGRIAARYDGELLTIPTVRVGTTVYANVVLRLTDSRTLTFRLESLEQLP